MLKMINGGIFINLIIIIPTFWENREFVKSDYLKNEISYKEMLFDIFNIVFHIKSFSAELYHLYHFRNIMYIDFYMLQRFL